MENNGIAQLCPLCERWDGLGASSKPRDPSRKEAAHSEGTTSMLGDGGRGVGGCETHPGCLPSPRWGGERVVYCGFALTFQAGRLPQDEQVGTEGPASG